MKIHTLPNSCESVIIYIGYAVRSSVVSSLPVRVDEMSKKSLSNV